MAQQTISAGVPVAIGMQPIVPQLAKHVLSPTVLIAQHLNTDNTNADPETRAYWVKLAQNLKVPIRCVHFTAPAALCEHNNAFRALNPDLLCHPQRFSSLHA